MLGLRIFLPVNLTYCKGLRAFIFKVICVNINLSLKIVFDLSFVYNQYCLFTPNQVFWLN